MESTYTMYQETESITRSIEQLQAVERKEKKVQADIDKQYADAMFWKNIGNILAEARETTDNSIAGTLTSSASYL